MKILLSLLLLIGNSFYLFSQNILRVDINGKKYANLILKVNVEKEVLFFEGLEKEPNSWVFSYPDSVYKKAIFFSLFSKEDSIQNDIVLHQKVENKELFCISCFYSPKSTTVLSYDSIGSSSYNALAYDFRAKRRVMTKNIRDHFSIIHTDDSELTAAMVSTDSKFSEFKQDNYTKRIDEFRTIVKRYPRSSALMARLALNANRFSDKNDLRSIFNQFGASLLETFYGEKIRNYLMDRFPNSPLLNVATGATEPIILKPEIPTLVVFSASWCIPCHKMIPLVKEINNDLGDGLAIVYISVDLENTRDNWKKMLKQEKFPFRSLFPADVNAFKQRIGATSLPLCYLVEKDGFFSAVEIRSQAGKNKLYETVMN